MSVTINGTSGVTTPGINNSEGYTGDGLSIAAGAPAGALQIDSAGNAGLGVTPSAWAAFKVIQIGSGALGSTTSAQNTVVAANAYYDGVWRYTTNGFAGYYQQNGGNHQFFTGASGTTGNPITFTQAMTLDSSGNLLVGTTSNPNTARQYIRYDTISTQMVLNTATTTAASTSWIHYAGQSGNGSSITTNNIFIFGNGNIQNANNSYGAMSDSKLKENIVDATPKLNNLCQVRVVNYNLIGDYEKHKQIGVIAQELEQIFPGMVEEAPDRDAEGNDLGTTTKSVKYSVFVPMLIKAIQEQQAMITELKARIEQLEAK